MSFAPPTFNLPVRQWRVPFLVTDPPSFTFLGNLAYGRRIPIAGTYSWGTPGPALLMGLLCPARSNISGINSGLPVDCVEVPAGSGRFYLVLWVDDVGRGFPNEYRLAAIVQAQAEALTTFGNPWNADPWPVPAP